CRYQRSQYAGEKLFRGGDQSHVCHRCGGGINRRSQSLSKMEQRRSRYRKGGCGLVWILRIPRGGGHGSSFILWRMSTSVYKINKGINKPIEFKGLKARYIW